MPSSSARRQLPWRQLPWRQRAMGTRKERSEVLLDGLRLQHADLNEDAREVIDGSEPDDLTVAQLVHVHGGDTESLAGRRQPHEAPGVGPGGRGNLDDAIPVDDEILVLEREIRKPGQPDAVQVSDRATA